MSDPENEKSNGHGGKRAGAGRPRKHAKPTYDAVAANPNLTPKQKKYVVARSEGHSQTDSAAIAGYARSTNASHIERLESVQDAFRSLLNLRVTDEKLADRIAEGLDATETKFFQKDGVVMDERSVADFAERRQYVELAARVKGVIPKETADVNVSVQALIAAIPEELRPRYLGSVSQEPDDGCCGIANGRYVTRIPQSELPAYQAQGWELIPQGEDGKQ